MALDRNQVAEEQNQVGSFGSTTYYVWKIGANRGRMAPPWPGAGKLAVLRYKHFSLPGEAAKMCYCYQKQHPQSGFVCPVCVEIANARKRGVNADRQDADMHPLVNWIDRMADPAIGPQVAELKLKPYNQLISIFLNTGCDLTSLELGYDVIITHANTGGRASYDAQVVPGAATPLHPDPAVAAHWIQKATAQDLRNYAKMPDWSSQDGQREWNKLVSSARALAAMYGSPVTVGPPTQQFTGNPPPPQFAPAPPPQQTQQSYPPQSYPPQTTQTQFAPPPQPPIVSHSQSYTPQQPQQPSYAPPPQQPFAPSEPAHVPTPPSGPSWTPQPAAPQPPPAPVYTPPAAPSAPPPQPQQQTLMPVAPVTSTVATSALDSTPPCYGRSYRDGSVMYQNVAGGWNDHPSDPVRSMRCGACAHELQCKDRAMQVYPADYSLSSVVSVIDDDVPF